MTTPGRSVSRHLVDPVRRFVSMRAHDRDERGAIAIIVAITSVILFVVGALAVDIGNTYAVRGMLQVQADYAAVAGADALPVSTTNTATPTNDQLRVAKRVAFYIACHTVRGQRELNPTIPVLTGAGDANPASTTQCGNQAQTLGLPLEITATPVDAYAALLLSTGKVSFPTTLQVKVIAPDSKVSFFLAPIVGANSSVQSKTATARIYSPGTAAPLALGLQCLLTAAGTTPAGIGNLATNVLPLNYIAPGPLGPTTSAEPTLDSTKFQAGTTGYTVTSVNASSTTQGTAASPTITVKVPTGTILGLGQTTFSFLRGSGPTIDVSVPTVTLVGTNLALAVPIPASIYNTVGVYYIQAKVPTGGGVYTTRANAITTTFTVNPRPTSTNLTACANLVDSPRKDNGNVYNAYGNLQLNLKNGLDHPLVPNPALVALTSPQVGATVPDVLNNLGSTLNGGSVDCPTTAPNQIDDSATRVSPAANCVYIASDGSRAGEFTRGMLSGTDPVSGAFFPGRLYCSAAVDCSHSTPITVPGFTGTYNNDSITTYINPASASLLNSATFFGLSSYLTDDLPVLTPPNNALLSDIYSSPRFMWAAIASRASTVGVTKCNKCAILTFRPVFITQSAPTTVATLDELTTQLCAGLSLLDPLCATLESTLYPALTPTSTANDHGLVTDGAGTLQAVRFQTIEPTALPPVPPNYNGPVTDYLGTGPKVIRLVR